MSRAVKPIWLLDIDGVINACDYYPTSWPEYKEIEARCAGRDYTVRYAQQVVDFINTVHSEGLAEIRWLTTWGREANDSFREKLGLPEFELAGIRYEARGMETWWKAILANVVATEDRPILWTDDDYPYYGGSSITKHWTNEHLVISPSIYEGLTPSHLKQIEEFLRDAA
jgi:hypothetical protein